MRLIDTSSLRLVTKNNADIPPYAILSHTWGADTDELTLQDLEQHNAGLGLGRLTSAVASRTIYKKPGYAKLQASAALALSHGYAYIWIDTCCIDKTSSAELSEAINSMFRWYRDAEVCYVYLDDVEVSQSEGSHHRYSTGHVPEPDDVPGAAIMRSSRWFTRGWTLQELIAPTSVQFYSRSWKYLGAKMEVGGRHAGFVGFLSQVTGIQLDLLLGHTALEEVSVAERMHWASRRRTTRVEDTAYCLMGLFGVNMPLLYGEGEQAFVRLQVEILRTTTDQSIFAWECSQDDVLRFQLCGLLAPSPACFRGSSGIRQAPPQRTTVDQESAPSTMTNAGLHVRFNLGRMVKDGDHVQYHAMLDCIRSPSPKEVVVPSIQLVALGGDQYARTLPNILDDTPLLLTGRRGEYRYVYVRQLSVQTAPSILFHLDASGSSSVIEVHPSRGWDRTVGVIRPERPNSRGILAAVRFGTGSGGTLVDVFVGMSSPHQSEIKTQFWCHQMASTGPDLAFAMSSFDKSRMQQRLYGKKLETRDFYCGRVASLKEEHSHGRAYLSLLVEDVPELHADSLPRTGIAIPDPRVFNELGDKFDSHSGDGWTTGLSRLFRRHVDPGRDPADDPKAYSTGFLIRVSRTASDPLLPRQISSNVNGSSASQIESLLTETAYTIRGRGMAEPTDLETYFSKLLIRACIANDVAGATELLDSIMSCAMVEAQTCFESTFDPGRSASSFEGFRPLHWATLLGHTEIVKLLLRHNALVMSTTTAGLTPIHIAATLGQLDVLTPLIKMIQEDEDAGKIDPLPSQPPFFDHPCHLAAAHVTSDSVHDMLLRLMGLPTRDDHTNLQRQTPTSFNQITNGLGETPLHRAAAVNNLPAVQAMVRIDEELHINQRDVVGRTPLWHAAAAGSHDVARFLLGQRGGADLTIPDKSGLTPLHVACRGGHNSTIALLLQHGGGSSSGNNNLPPHPDTVALTAAHFAALGGNVETLSILRTHGEDLDRFVERGGKGIAPSHIALVNFNSASFRYLVEVAGCDVTREGAYHILLDPTQLSGIKVTSRGVRLRPSGDTAKTTSRGPVNVLEYVFEHGEVTLAGY